MARLKELKCYKRQGKTFVRLDFTNPKADLLNYPNGVIFQKGYRSNQTAERKLMELRAIWQADLISEDGMMRRMQNRERWCQQPKSFPEELEDRASLSF